MDTKKTLAYKIGQALATTIGVCIITIIIALTAKLVLWIF